MICSNCAKEFSGRNYGLLEYVGGKPAVKDICSFQCRALARAKANDRTPAKITADDADPGVAGPRKARKLTQAEMKRKLRPRETDISKAIGKRLTNAGIWNTRTQSGQVKTHTGHLMQLCRQGTPDRVFNHGLNVWIEVKRPGEKPSAEQIQTIAKLQSNGSLAFVLDDSTDLDFILDGLRRWDREIKLLANTIRTIGTDIQSKIDMNAAARNGKK